jgi:heterodisulfide reductase subunit D
MSPLSSYIQEIMKCGRCGYCLGGYMSETCPARYVIGFESGAAKGRMLAARAMIQGRLEYSPQLAQRIYTCFLCGACKTKCEDAAGIDTVEIIRATRSEIFENGRNIPDEVEKLGTAVETRHNIFASLPERRIAWITPEIRVDENAELLYFPGCVTSYKFSEIAQSTSGILNKARVSFSTLGTSEWCCGDPLLSTGQYQLAREMARHNVEEIKRRGVKQVLVSCPGCYKTFKQDYPKLLGLNDLPFQVIHSSQLFHRLSSERRISFRETSKEVLTYHDPCELGRLSGIYEQPRELIQQIPGIRLVEMDRNRERAWCCGGGGAVKMTYPNQASKVALVRLKEAESCGATGIVSSCPTCKWNLSDNLKLAGSGLKVIDLSELMHSSLK